MWEYAKVKLIGLWSEASQVLVFLDQQMVFWTFAAIGILSSLFLIVSMFLGDISEAIHGLFDSEHDFGGGDHDTSGTDHAADIHHDLPDHVGGNPSFFSLRFGLSFLSGFGLTGTILTYYHMHVVLSSACGSLVGLALSGITYAIVRGMASQQASFNITSGDLIDQEARVIVGLPEKGIGQVLVQVGEITITKLAQSENGLPIPENARVKIMATSEQTVIVKKLFPAG